MKLKKLLSLIDQQVRIKGVPLDLILHEDEVFFTHTLGSPRFFCTIQYVGSTFVYTSASYTETLILGFHWIFDLDLWVKCRRRSIQRSLFSQAPQAEAYAAFRRWF